MTQWGDVGFTLGHIVGALVGVGLFAGGVALVYRVKERRKESRNERPPQSEKILRPAGWSAMQRVDASFEKVLDALLCGAAGAAMTGLVFGGFVPLVAAIARNRVTWRQVVAVPGFYLALSVAVLGVGCLAWSVFSFVRVSRLIDEARAWRFGLRGEQAVAEKLLDREIAAAGYVVFHDVPGENGKHKWNVDHVVVGPGGVFVLETKARSKRTATRDQDESRVVFDGEKLQFPWCVDWDVVGEVRRNADWVGKLIKKVAPEGVLVQPVIVVPGWYVESKGNYDIKAMPATYLVGYLKGAKRLYSPKEVDAIADRLQRECRDLEF